MTTDNGKARFDQTGIDAWLDLREQCVVVGQAWEQLSHFKSHSNKKGEGQTEAAHPQETFNESLDDLRDLYVVAEEHGVVELVLIQSLTEWLPPPVFDKMLRSTATA